MNQTTILILLAGLGLLILGAELLVRGASALAARAGISPLIIGLTVVAFGTSSPETAVSLQAVLDGQTDLSVGNVVGSNIFNVIFILGVAALVTPLSVAHQLIRLDVPIMIAASALAFVFGLDGSISLSEGIVLFSGLVIYILFLIWQSRRELAQNSGVESKGADDNKPVNRRNGFVDVFYIVVGLGLLVTGSNWLVESATDLATALGVSSLVIGLTIVSAGTSLPEVATSVIASIRGETDIAVGNIVGSNIFNLLAVLGLAAIAAPDGLPIADSVLHFDLPFMLAVAIACLPIFFTGHVVSRWEGGLFLGYYIAYTAYLILASLHHDLLPAFSGIMLWFVVPLTIMALLISFLRAIGRRPNLP